MMTIHAPRVAERFRAKVDERGDDECWLWCGARTKDGYGILSAGRRGDPPLRAHRVAYELHYGPVPEGLHVLHTCDNPPCCNPAHLYAGTNAQNIADKVARGRQSRTALQGSRNPCAVLNETIVREIRAMLAQADSRQTSKAVRARYRHQPCRCSP